MSYSFQVRGASVALALAAASQSFAKVIETQPEHAADMAPALNTASAFAELLKPDESKDVSISMSGWLNWNYSGKEPEFCGASVTVSVVHVARDA